MTVYKYLINEYTENQLKTFGKYCDKSRPQSIVAHYFLKKLLARHYSCDISEIQLQHNAFGKPYYKDDLFFSITHTGNYVYIVTDTKNIGVDAEAIRPIRRALISRTTSHSEKAELEKSDNFDIDYLKMWTVKEAYFKLIGSGITDLTAISEKEIREKYSVTTEIKENHILTVITEK